MMTAAPLSSATRRITGIKASTATGARPIDISSISRSLGDWTRARAMASICCSPPERSATRSLARAAERREEVEDRVEVGAAGAASLRF